MTYVTHHDINAREELEFDAFGDAFSGEEWVVDRDTEFHLPTSGYRILVR